MRRLIPLLLVVALALSVLASSASARRPTLHEKRAIRASAEVWLKQHLEPAFYRKTHVLRIVVSSRNHQYAKVLVLVRDVGFNAMLLRATSRGWKVVDFGSGGFSCGIAPRRVLDELLGGCVSA